jgi:hypothetical protein
MSVKSTLREAIERGESQAQDNIERYFSAVTSITEQTGKVLAKLPSGDKLSPRYVELVSKASDAQKDAVLKLLAAQAKVQTWPLRESTPAKPARRSNGKPSS